MIKETDASKCDERRVKNKLNPLTHKKKGETHIMGIQGMKNWKLGAFFVISLMLMVGLFANIAIAHPVADGVADEGPEDGEQTDDADTPIGEVEITPKVTADSMVDLVIRYESDGVLAKEVDPVIDATDDTVVSNASTYGRIQITLPVGWGPSNVVVGDAVPLENQINQRRVSGKFKGAPHLVLNSRRVDFEAAEINTGTDPNNWNEDDDNTAAYDVRGLDVTAGSTSGATVQWMITIDVDDMPNNGYVELTIKNLAIPALTVNRQGRTADIGAEALAALMATVEVLANQYPANVNMSAEDDMQNYDSARDDATITALNSHGPDPDDIHDDNLNEDEDNTQPLVAVERKKLGELTVSKDSVTAGSLNDLTLTYKFTEEMESPEAANQASVVEIKLPEGWDDGIAPEYFDFDADLPTAERTTGYVYADRSVSVKSVLEEAVVTVIQSNGMIATFDGPDGANDNALTDSAESWYLRIELAGKVAKTRRIVLHYKNAKAPRIRAADDDKLKVEAFSDPDIDDDATNLDEGAGIPQHPVAEHKAITVTYAASGSGMIAFDYNGDPVLPLGEEGVTSNTDASIPAGTVADDAVSLAMRYNPEGDMGEGALEVKLPRGWSATEALVNGENKLDGNTVSVTFPDEYFGEDAEEELVIEFQDITVPNAHGNYNFITKTKYDGGSLKQLSPTPKAFVGNAEAKFDTVSVDITPSQAYQNQDNVDFEFTITANGPMYASDITITMPEDLDDLQIAERTDPNHVRRVSASVSGVTVAVDGRDDNIILIKTGDLNKGGRIKVRLDNVDLEDVSGGFSVSTRTRGDNVGDDDDLETDFVEIRKENDDRSITGGLIRTIVGSGTMAVEPLTLEQGSRNKNFKLTFTATTDFSDLALSIEAPSVIETELQEGDKSGDGHVSGSGGDFHADHKGEDDQLVVENNIITWDGLILRRGQKFITNIKRVDLLEETDDDAQWIVKLGDTDITGADTADSKANPPMVVVGTMEDDVVFEVVDEDEIPNSTPSYPASSMQSIRFRFTTENTAIQPGGRLWFTVPVGWTLPSLTDKKNRATVGILDYDDDGNEIFVTKMPATGKDVGSKMVLTVSGRSVILSIGEEGGIAEDGDPVIIRYGTDDLTATGFPVQISASAKGTADSDEDGLSIRGHFRVSDDFRQRDAGTIWADVTNVVDGSGTAAIKTSPATVRAGSKKSLITVTFTGVGTMDGGAVRLTIPEDWGAMQEDPLELNHIDVDVSGPNAALSSTEVIDDGLSVVATLKTFGKGNKVIFTYGGGTGARDSRGATAQADIGEATFMVESMGSADGEYVDIGEDDIADSVDPLMIEVKGAESGSGEGVVEIMASKSGDGLYDGETDVDEKMMQVHAGDDSTYLVFTYTPSQTIAEGELRFTVPGTWTAPQNEATGEPGYTYLEEIGGAIVSNETYDSTTQSVVADISLTLEDEIKIHYGWYDTENGGAVAPDEVPTGGYSQFAIAVKGTVDEDLAFENIDGEDIMVMVRVQRSGGGMAAVSPMTVNAGDMMSAITVTYTADGQVDAGMLKLTIPGTSEDWDAPTMDNVTIVGGGANTAARFGGAHTAAELLALAAAAIDDVDLGAMDVFVDNVMLAGGETVTFTYTSAMAQGTTGAAAFAVAIDGGDGPDTGPMAVGGMTTVTVDEAAPGSGMAMAMTDGIVLPGSEENTLTFTYTVAGEASYPSDVRVAVTDDWTSVVSSNYTVTHKRAGRTHLDMVEKKSPVDGAMVARVISGEKVLAGDEIIFELMNVTAPATVGSYPFAVTFRGQAIAANPMVIVQTAEASMLAIEAPASVVGDAGAVPVAITIMIQDAAGGEAASADATTVNLTSTNTTTGSFTSDGEAVTMITIPAGMSSAMVYYSDTRVGSTAIIVASDSAAGFDAATVSILVTTSVDTVDSVTVSTPMAKAGDVMITVTGTPGKTGTNAVFSVGELTGDLLLTESATSPGTYTGTFTVVLDLQDGTHDVMATLGEANATKEDALTIDTMMPLITLAAPALGTTVANGGSVTITATAGDGTGSGIASVMADVSMLDSTQTDVALMMGADGSYSVDVAISDDNAAVNGSKTITVTAMDAAGNSAMAEAMVMLDNKMSFTSMIPAGTSLFHVPLDVDGLDTVGDLKMKIGDAADLAIVYDSATGSWNSRSDAVAITSSLGIILSMSAEATVIFDGDTWDGGTSTLSLSAGANLIGLPVNDPRVTNVSDIAGLFAANVVSSVIVSTDDGFKLVGAAGDPGDAPVMGDAAYLVTASAAGNAVLIGDGWTYSAMMAAPVALAGYNVEGQTAVLDVQGTVVDEISGLAREGFRVKVKNLSTKAALSSVSSVEAADGYNMTFVDLKAGNAARIGDVLEISADSPNPLIGVQPVRHIVTVDDVKNSTIQLEELIAYEIPAETELLRNYPNPFNPETWIPYRLAQDADVSLTIYDTSGTLVRSIDIGHQTAAVYDTKAKAIYWDGRNRFGEQVASGLYFYHLSAGDDFSATRRMVILK